jgi:hypothetical protein
MVSLVLVSAASHTDADSRRELRQKQIAAAQEHLAVAARALPDAPVVDVLVVGSSRVAAPKRVFLGSTPRASWRAPTRPSSSCLGGSSRAFPGAGRMMQRYSSQKLQLTTDFVQDSGWAPALRRRRFVDEELTRFS